MRVSTLAGLVAQPKFRMFEVLVATVYFTVAATGFWEGLAQPLPPIGGAARVPPPNNAPRKGCAVREAQAPLAQQPLQT